MINHVNDNLNGFSSSSMASHLTTQLEQLLTQVEELQLNSLHLVLPAWSFIIMAKPS